MDDKKKKIAKAVAKKIPGVGPALSGYSIANALRQIARNKKDMVPYKEFVKSKPAKRNTPRFVGPKPLSKTAKQTLERTARREAKQKAQREGRRRVDTATQKMQRKLEIKRNLKNKYGTADPKLIKEIKKNREILAREKLKKDEKLKNKPFTSGNKGQAAWGGYGATGKKLYKKGGKVGGKCKVDGIAIRGRTRANHK